MDLLIEATVLSIKPAAQTCIVINLLHNRDDYSFKPGQWIDLYVPIEGKNIGGYTITSPPQSKGSIELVIRQSSTHPVTQYLHQKLKVGDKLQITLGQGKFYLKEEIKNENLIFIAGGIGITPILSMLRSLDYKEMRAKLFYSAASIEDLLFVDELKPFSILSTTRNYRENDECEHGRINIELLKKYKVDFSSHFFICGPKEMIESLVKSLREEGVATDKIYFEKWW